MMILPSREDAIHKAWMLRLLTAIADDSLLAGTLRFKGGTYGAMRGILPRFSIDLDFDLVDVDTMKGVRGRLEAQFKRLGLRIEDQSKMAPQYFLKYDNKPNARNTLKLDVSFPPFKNNDYEPVHFDEIDRILHAQTIPTLFANKLVTLMDRYQRHGSVAGRDLFDIHTLFLQGHRYKPEIIEERTGQKTDAFLKSLILFIQKKVTQTVIDEDLNTLLPDRAFHSIRKILKPESIQRLQDERERARR